MTIRVKRVYETAAESDGERILADRLWPRGMRKEDGQIDRWLKDLAPSAELRSWFGHDPAKWEEFKARYFQELAQHDELVAQIAAQARAGTVTLVYAARDEHHNNAVALKEYLEHHVGL